MSIRVTIEAPNFKVMYRDDEIPDPRDKAAFGRFLKNIVQRDIERARIYEAADQHSREMKDATAENN